MSDWVKEKKFLKSVNSMLASALSSKIFQSNLIGKCPLISRISRISVAAKQSVAIWGDIFVQEGITMALV